MEVIMKLSIFVAGAVCLGLSACASPNAGNPDGAGYIGAAGSTYDTAANPPRANGSVSYDPNAPMPPSMPPADATNGSAMTAPAPAGGARTPR
jgi:hypothetical protein